MHKEVGFETIVNQCKSSRAALLGELVTTMLQGAPPSGGVSSEPELDEEYIVSHVKKNRTVLSYCRTCCCAASGTVTGILGITGVWGFVSFLICHVIVSLGLYAKMEFDLPKFTPRKGSGLVLFLFEDIADLILTFILLWTLAYSLIFTFV
eukprot:538965_1